MTKEEIWKPVAGYEGEYEISSLGQLHSLKSGNYTYGNPCPGGYLITSLYSGKTLKTHRMHRLVAQAFIPNPEHYPYVNHKDENKHNNCVDNLEWCTEQYNGSYGGVAKLISRNSGQNKVVEMLDENGNVEREFHNMSEAARFIGVHHTTISLVCSGKRKTAKGRVFRFKEVAEREISDKAKKKALALFPVKNSCYRAEHQQQERRKIYGDAYDTAIEEAIAWLTDNAAEHIDCYADRCELIRRFKEAFVA